MTIRPIIEVPDKRLKTVSQRVTEVTDDTRALMDDMLETMYDANGIGLAAIQVGVADRVIVMDISQRMQADVEAQEDTEENLEEDPEEVLGETGPRYFVNPEIVWASEETRNYQEGCLSVPGFYDDVARPAQCRVAFLDYDGQSQELECDGLLATCIQHEMDHLEGIVFLDRLSRLKRQIVLKKIAKAERDAASAE
ncbi:MAG: peptide deformylase [Rhodobiaceae bacterium]|jgi:peptide deformylase|nr:peptide deformylase [Rhodobiaceae bacterium]OUT91199.1 MAG: peptide deformylase [Rhizobiales bacterium TMED29]HAL84774.1 peptide deformylase [Rhodobiaceae bacterium]|tara:strand:+ start:394 stop:981 length:588 start_codon:yes stop_codon:yes gene_type:complete